MMLIMFLIHFCYAQESLLLKLKFNSPKPIGEIHGAIYSNEKTWLDKEKTFKSFKILPSKEEFEVSLPAGEYAIAFYQDLNKNQEFDQGFLGIPLEPYGFSRNPKVLFSAPDFKESAFLLNKNMTIILEFK